MLAHLRTLLGSPSASASHPTEGRETNVGQGSFGFEVVGEQSYQGALRKVSAGRVERGERVTLVCHLRYEINSHTHGPQCELTPAAERRSATFLLGRHSCTRMR